MTLKLLGVETDDDGSPTLYATDHGPYGVQGWRVTDADALGAMRIPGHETAVEIPAALLRFAPPAERGAAS